jgi:nitrate/nitrite-specific signal transduction histidine kinase
VVIFSSLDIVNANKAVVKPVESLGQFIQTFRNDHGLRTRVELAGTAEIVQLGEQINQMIDEI